MMTIVIPCFKWHSTARVRFIFLQSLTPTRGVTTASVALPVENVVPPLVGVRLSLRGRFFGSGDTISRRGGPLWPLAGVWKGPLSTRHGGQPQGPQPRSTPPLPLRDNPRYGTKPTPERVRLPPALSAKK